MTSKVSLHFGLLLGLILFVLSIAPLRAQYLRPGFVVLNSGDTLDGSLVYPATQTRPFRCIIKPKSGPEVEYTPEEIIAYGLKGNSLPLFESYQRESGATFVRILARGHLTYIEAGISQYIIRENSGTEHAFVFGKKATALRGDQRFDPRETYSWDGGLLYVDQLDNIHRFLNLILDGETLPSPIRKVKSSQDLLRFIAQYNRTKKEETPYSIHYLPPPSSGPSATLLGLQTDLGIGLGYMNGNVVFADIDDATLNNSSAPASISFGASLEVRNLSWSKHLYYQGRVAMWSHEIGGGGTAVGPRSTPTTNYNYTLSGTIGALAISHTLGFDFRLFEGVIQLGPQVGIASHSYSTNLIYTIEQYNLNLDRVVDELSAQSTYEGSQSTRPIYGIRAKALLPSGVSIEASAQYLSTNQVLTRNPNNPLSVRSVRPDASTFQGLNLMGTISYRIINILPKA